MARSTDSNGLAANGVATRATASTRSRWRRGRRIAASWTSRQTSSLLRQAASNTARASSNGRSRQQSTTVRTGVVTHPSTVSAGAGVRQCRTTPARRSALTLRLRGTVT